MKKKILLVLTLANFTTAFAAGSNVYDLMYFPEKGTLAGETALNFTSTKYTLDFISNPFAEVTAKESSLDQTLMYTLAPKTMLGVTENYQIDSKTETKFGAASTLNGTTNKGKSATGFSEPEFIIKQRVLEQESSSVNLDLQANFSPKLGDAKSSTTTKAGNNLRGSNRFEAQVEVGKKDEGSQWKFQANYLLNGKAKTQSASVASDVTETDSSNIFGGAFTKQWKLAPTFELGLTAGVAFIGEQEFSNATDHTKDVIDSSTAFLVGPSFIFNLSEKAMINFSVTYATLDDPSFHETDTTNNSTTTLMRNDNSTWHFSMMTRYEF